MSNDSVSEIFKGEARADFSRRVAITACVLAFMICTTIVIKSFVAREVEVHIIEYTSKSGETVEVKDRRGKSKWAKRVIHKLTEE